MSTDWRDSKHPTIRFKPGRPLPMGATITPQGVQFALFSRNAVAVSLLFFEDSQSGESFLEIELTEDYFRTGDIWHVLVQGISAGALYLYKIDGPYEPHRGKRFNANKLLLDPYTKAITGNFRWDLKETFGYDLESPEMDLSFSTTFDAAVMPKCIVIDDEFDWQDDRPLNHPLHKVVIYESHVRTLSKHPSSKVKHPGTYRGIIEMIPYLKELGITSLELLPLQEFDEFEYEDRTNPITGERLKNYWGYSSIAFFAPKGSYAADGSMGQQVNEFKEMVRELHKAGIEVILDVVFNHTGEGDQTGHTFSFRGIDNEIYYILSPDKRYYQNYSGTGNTLNCNHPVVRLLIIECLRYWVMEMHVDGFRFDLGSILGRDENGNLMDNPPTLKRIAEDPILRNTKIIAEAWDAGGAYQVGSFPGGRWAEWNDRFRDDVRSFWRNDQGKVANFATRFAGSSDLYMRDGRKPFHSINFITAHDGFTLNDLISFNQKHNSRNGEDNRDGHSDNISYNYGAEGFSRDPNVLEARRRQAKNFIATLLLSTGTPMILGGDEIRRTQLGNNNAYCHDNEISWMDYTFKERYAEHFRFTKEIINFRNEHPALKRTEFFSGRDNDGDEFIDITWYDEHGDAMNWKRQENMVALLIDGSKKEIHSDQEDSDFYIMMNAGLSDQYFLLPPKYKDRHWHRIINTAKESPYDFVPVEEAEAKREESYLVESRSLVVMMTKIK